MMIKNTSHSNNLSEITMCIKFSRNCNAGNYSHFRKFPYKKGKRKDIVGRITEFPCINASFLYFFFYHIPVYTVGFTENGTDSCMRICAYRWRLLGCVKNKIKI